MAPTDFAGWLAAGATGFGLGSELYRPEYPLTEIADRARRAVEAWTTACNDTGRTVG
ncbi:beta/alpha barrel domain-containing protein [Tsukamurella soli]|uniref:hypothetical protein n=1 Tax=Tsukamurella soli TaxID=644556 RepID=UPI0036063DCB